MDEDDDEVDKVQEDSASRTRMVMMEIARLTKVRLTPHGPRPRPGAQTTRKTGVKKEISDCDMEIWIW